MFRYKVYKDKDGFIKHDMWYDNDKNNIFVKNKFDLRDLIEETISLIVKQKRINFKSIKLSELHGGKASITVNGVVTTVIEWNADKDQFEISLLKDVVVSPIRLCMLLLSPTLVIGSYNDEE